MKVRVGLAWAPVLALFTLSGCVHPHAHTTPMAQTAGAAMFQSQGCPQCHQVNGVGGHKGPDLTHVGRRLNRQQIEDQIVNGGNAMPAYKDVLTPVETASLVRYLGRLR